LVNRSNLFIKNGLLGGKLVLSITNALLGLRLLRLAELQLGGNRINLGIKLRNLPTDSVSLTMRRLGLLLVACNLGVQS
jgi:hypothetical protein